MPGYWLWDGSVIKVGDTYHLFAARWPKGHPFPDDYRWHSEIVRATARLEDFDYFKRNGRYYILCEDNVGGVTGHERWGALLVSDDGLGGWHPVDRTAAYDHAIPCTDGTILHCRRRERPQLLTEDGAVTVLFTAVYDGRDTWCQPVPVVPPLRVDP
jgi:hypothetical protein